ncbi:MAG TPA: cupin domain-containing protein [Candidatus Limnocylindrales bacterium]|nr:cupin domain-containing protein [Candidatus Limnocylindrales bacterium]
MDESQPVTAVRPAERVEGEQSPGMTREQAIAVPGMWAGLVRTEAHMTTGWHHHADYDTSIYVVHGLLRMEFGPGGSHTVEAGPGDFIHVPKGVVHREGNPGDQESHLVVVRAGHGPAVVNVDGPAPA